MPLAMDHKTSFYDPCSRSLNFFMKSLEVSIFFEGKEVSVKAPICLFVFINFEVFSSLDIEFNNTTVKFPRNEVNPKLSELHKTYRHVILAPRNSYFVLVIIIVYLNEF